MTDSQKTKRKQWLIDPKCKDWQAHRKGNLCQVDCGSACHLIIYRDYCKVKADGKLVYSGANKNSASELICKPLVTA